MTTLRDTVIFKFIENEDRIAIMDLLKDSNYFFNIHSKNNSRSINSLFSNTINYHDFTTHLQSEELKEFEIVINELKKFNLLKEEAPLAPLVYINRPSAIFIGKHISLTIEFFEHLVHAVTYSEGETCSPAGMTYCETNSGNASFPRELWQCVPGSPSNWAAMGQSC